MKEKCVFKSVFFVLFVGVFLFLFFATGASFVRAEDVSSERQDSSIRASFKISDFSDTMYNKYTVIRNIYFAEDREGASRGNHSAGDRIPMYDIVFSDGSCHVAYCIEPGEDVNEGWSYTADIHDYSKDNHWLFLKKNYPRIAENIQITAGCASSYLHDKEARAAAQIVIWELVSGMRDKDTGVVIDTYLRDCMDGAGLFDYYYTLFDRSIAEYRMIPVCLDPDKGPESVPYTLKFDEKTQDFCLRIEDQDLPYFKTVDWHGVTGLEVVELTESSVVLRSKNYSPGMKICNGFKNTADFYATETPFYIINSIDGPHRGQTLVSGCEPFEVPIKFTYTYEDVGILKIVKNSEDGKVDGIRFCVKETVSGDCFVVDTDNEGNAQLYLKEGLYEVSEVVPDGYNEVGTQNVKVTLGNTEKVFFYNSLIKFYNLEVNYFERATGARLEESVSSVQVEGSSYNLYKEVMLPIDGYIWDGYEGDEYEGVNLSSDKVIDVYYTTAPNDIPVDIPDTDDNVSDTVFIVISVMILVVPHCIYRKYFLSND